MQHQYSVGASKPQLFINTQFSSEQESETFGHFQFEPKDVISQANSFDIDHQQKNEEQLIKKKLVEEQEFDVLITGIVQLSCVIDSWKVNAVYDAFTKIRNTKPKRLASLSYQKATAKQLNHSKSVANLRNQNNLMSRLHRRKNTNSSQKDLQRAEVLNQIITKLHSRERSDKKSSQSKSLSRTQFQKQSSYSKKSLVKQKLKKLQHMLKQYKSTNQQSNQMSTVYYTKHLNKGKKQGNQGNNYTLESSLNQDSQIIISQNQGKLGTFKKLKSDIIQVKTQFNQLKHINQVYRRQNYILRNQRAEQSLGINSYKNFLTDRNFRKSSPIHNYQTSKMFGHPQINQNYSQNYPQSYSQNYPQNYYSGYPYSYPYSIPSPSFQPPPPPAPPLPSVFSYPNHHPEFRQVNHVNLSNNRCRDARHQNYWKTMVPETLQMNISQSRVGDIRQHPIVFCFKCGCKCAEKEQRSNITERKGYLSSPLTNLKDFL